MSSEFCYRGPLVSLTVAGCLLLAGTHLPGQVSQDVQRPPDGGTREFLVSILIPSLPQAPFSAIVNTEWIRQLADGTTITLTNHRAIARDRTGRIFQERRLLVPEDGKHESVVTQIEISDPVRHKLYICKPKENVCQLEFFSAPDFDRMSPLRPSRNPAGPLNSENLGQQSIGGLQVEGRRETAVIETGAIGNNSPIEVTREFWYSPQLGLNLISKRQDPRFGTQIFEVSGISLADPDPKLFEAPSGARVIDMWKSTAVPLSSTPPE